MRPDIENPAAYEAAIVRNIKANAWKTKRANFERDEPELYAQLNEIWNPMWTAEARGTLDADGYDNNDGTGWQKDGSHLALEIFTPKQQRALQRKLGWLRDGYDEYGSLTEKQIVKAKEIVEETVANVKRYEDEDERRKANAEPWENGRQEFPCTIVSLQLKDVPKFHYHDSGKAWKMIVQNESGARLYCTAPSKLLDVIFERAESEWDEDKVSRSARGVELVLRVNVERADDDPIFGFGKRPHIVEVK